MFLHMSPEITGRKVSADNPVVELLAHKYVESMHPYL